jgi:hypothetical protein
MADDPVSAGHFIPNREGYPYKLSKDPAEQAQETNEQAVQADALPEKTQKAAIESVAQPGLAAQQQDKDSDSARPSNADGRGRKVDIDT